MVAAVTQRSATRRRRQSARVALPILTERAFHSPQPRLPHLEALDRQGPVLRPNPLSSVVAGDVDGLNLLAGCPQRCVFCYARAYPGRSAVETVGLYVNTADRLREELRGRRRQPRAVYLCPSTDPFPPYLEAQVEACRVVDVLAEHGIESWIMTRGFIRPFAMEVLQRHRRLVRVTVSITTLDNRLRRLTEPLAAPPRLRLKQLRELKRLGIHTQAAVDPLLPGITDTRANLAPLIDALADAGVTQITASYMFLRPGIRDQVTRELGAAGWDQPLLEPYAEGYVLPMGQLAPAQHLPRRERQDGYALLMALAANRGIKVSVSALSNPDFAAPTPLARSPRWRQRDLACVAD